MKVGAFYVGTEPSVDELTRLADDFVMHEVGGIRTTWLGGHDAGMLG